jgi:hypothetical protein
MWVYKIPFAESLGGNRIEVSKIHAKLVCYLSLV